MDEPFEAARATRRTIPHEREEWRNGMAFVVRGVDVELPRSETVAQTERVGSWASS